MWGNSMGDGISYLATVTSLKSQESSEEGFNTAPVSDHNQAHLKSDNMGQGVLLTKQLIDDLVKVAKIDGKDAHLVDAVIDRFCNKNFTSEPDQAERVATILKIGIHSAMQNGLTKDEVSAALAQVGNSFPNKESPLNGLEDAKKITRSNDAGIDNGVARFILAVDNGSKSSVQISEPNQHHAPTAQTIGSGVKI